MTVVLATTVSEGVMVVVTDKELEDEVVRIHQREATISWKGSGVLITQYVICVQSSVTQSRLRHIEVTITEQSIYSTEQNGNNS